MPHLPSIDDHLPLRPVVLQVLVLLADGPKHGWAILQEAEAVGRASTPGIATLYRTLQRLEADALIERRPELDDADRRRVFAITPLGRAVATAEASRLTALLAVARTAHLLDERDAR